MVPGLPQGVFHGRRSSSRGIPRAEAWCSLCLVFHNGYSTLDNARWDSPKPEDICFLYSSGIPQSYSQLPRKPAGVVSAAVTDLPQGVFLGRRPSSVGIPRTPVFLGKYSSGGSLKSGTSVANMLSENGFPLGILHVSIGCCILFSFVFHRVCTIYK